MPNVKVGNNLSKPFVAKRGFRQVEALFCDFFICILMQGIICAAGLRHTGTIFYKSVMPLAYVDDVDIIGRNNCEVAAIYLNGYPYASILIIIIILARTRARPRTYSKQEQTKMDL